MIDQASGSLKHRHAASRIPQRIRLGVGAEGVETTRGGTLKYPVRNPLVRRYLQKLSDGTWQKVIKQGEGGEVHYFEHASGQVAGVKFFPS